MRNRRMKQDVPSSSKELGGIIKPIRWFTSTTSLKKINKKKFPLIILKRPSKLVSKNTRGEKIRTKKVLKKNHR